MDPVKIDLEEVLNEIQSTPDGKIRVELAVERVLNRKLRERLDALEKSPGEEPDDGIEYDDEGLPV